MDIGEITKVASRKRLNADAEKLREKVSRETAKIIKLKVAQDTAYWDLKEKLQQVEGNHERLQQNMVEVQMQHEAISGQYQDELRLRPDTLNKLTSTREICDVLEEYSERLKETLSRCKSDQASLCEAYQKSGQLVREMKIKHERSDEKNKQLIENLQEKTKLACEHQNQLVQYLSAAKQQTDAELEEAKLKLAGAQAQKDELSAAVGDLRRQLEQGKHDLQMRDTTIANIQKEMKQLIQEFNYQSGEMKTAITKKDKDIQEANEAAEALKRALNNQETFTESVREQNSQLQEQLATTEEQLQTAQKEQQLLLQNIEDMKSEISIYKEDITKLTEVKNDLEKTVEDKNNIIKDLEAEIENIKQKLNETETEKSLTVADLVKTRSDYETEAARVIELQAACEKLQINIAEIESEFYQYKTNAEAKAKEQLDVIVSKDKELDNKVSTIGQLMGEVKNATDGTERAEAALTALRQEADAEREQSAQRDARNEQRIEHLQAIVTEKENELSKQMTIILDMRTEKDRLQERIQGMQSKIDNIQKELSGPQPRPPMGEAPELDDNAVAFAPTPSLKPRSNGNDITSKQNMAKTPTIAAPKSNRGGEPRQLDSMLYNIFSDSSMDENTIDPREVNRRFEALTRGEIVPHASLNALKRSAHPTHKDTNIDDVLSLSQVKNDLKKKDSKTFFKNKRNDSKFRKIK